MPIKGQCRTTKKRTCFTMKSLYWEEGIGYWTREIFSLRLWSTEECIFFDIDKDHREEDGAIHFLRIKENIQNNQFPYSLHWSDKKWKVCLAGGGGDKIRFQYCTDDSGTIVYFRALQGHSGRNLIDFSTQDNVVIPSNFFQYIYHVGCAVNLHSFISWGLTPGGQSSSKRLTVFFLLVDLMDKKSQGSWWDWLECTTSCTILAQSMEETPRHGERGRHQSCDSERLEVLSDSIECNHPPRNISSLSYSKCIPKVVRMETGEVWSEKVYMSPRPPPKISCKYEWKRELGSEHAQRSEVGKLCRSFQSKQPILNPNSERTGDPLSGMTRELFKMEEKRLVLRRSMLVLSKKNLCLQNGETRCWNEV